MKIKTFEVNTSGQRFYNITETIKNISLEEDGILFLFLPHTSCGLCISEAYDPTAIEDVQQFMNHIAPESLDFIAHTAEGVDDSPSHMKSILLHQSLSIPVEESKIRLGRWQGIFLAEFRKQSHTRIIQYKYFKG